MDLFHTYSDYSCHPLGAGYAYVVAKYDDPVQVITMRSRKCEAQKSQIGEIMAIVAALKKVPDNCHAIVHSDLSLIKQYSKTKIKRAEYRLREPLKQLKQQCSRIGKVTFRYVPPNSRNAFFRWCHNQARRRANLPPEGGEEDWQKEVGKEIDRLRTKNGTSESYGS